MIFICPTAFILQSCRLIFELWQRTVGVSEQITRNYFILSLPYVICLQDASSSGHVSHKILQHKTVQSSDIPIILFCFHLYGVLVTRYVRNLLKTQFVKSLPK